MGQKHILIHKMCYLEQTWTPRKDSLLFVIFRDNSKSQYPTQSAADDAKSPHYFTTFMKVSLSCLFRIYKPLFLWHNEAISLWSILRITADFLKMFTQQSRKGANKFIPDVLAIKEVRCNTTYFFSSLPQSYFHPCILLVFNLFSYIESSLQSYRKLSTMSTSVHSNL